MCNMFATGSSLLSDIHNMGKCFPIFFAEKLNIQNGGTVYCLLPLPQSANLLCLPSPFPKFMLGELLSQLLMINFLVCLGILSAD